MKTTSYSPVNSPSLEDTQLTATTPSTSENDDKSALLDESEAEQNQNSLPLSESEAFMQCVESFDRIAIDVQTMVDMRLSLIQRAEARRERMDEAFNPAWWERRIPGWTTVEKMLRVKFPKSDDSSSSDHSNIDPSNT